MMTVISVGVHLVLFIFLCFMMLRNVKIIKYRTHLLNMIDIMSGYDRKIGVPDRRRERLAVFNGVTHRQMLYEFWLPVYGFYEISSIMDRL